MEFSKENFENFLRQLTNTREQVDTILQHATQMTDISQTGMLLLWHSIYDTLMTERDPAERLKWGTLIEKVFSALTARRALELRENKSESSHPPLDTESLSELQHKLKLL